MEKAVANAANVILSSDISRENHAVPYERFRNQEIGEGFINVFPEEDGVLRKSPSLFGKKNEQGDWLIDTPFPVKIAAARLYPDGAPPPDLSHSQYMQLGGLKIPYAGEQATDGFYINFTGPSGNFPRIHFSQVIQKQFNPEDIAEKIVLIGSMNPYFHDYYPVPFAANETEGEKPMRSMYGVEIHANALHTLLNRTFLEPISHKILLAVLLCAGLLAAAIAIFPRWNPFILAAVALAVVAAFFLGCYVLFLRHYFVAGTPVYLAIIFITITGTVARQMEEASERK